MAAGAKLSKSGTMVAKLRSADNATRTTFSRGADDTKSTNAATGPAESRAKSARMAAECATSNDNIHTHSAISYNCWTDATCPNFLWPTRAPLLPSAA
jgi:hypothetical protein